MDNKTFPKRKPTRLPAYAYDTAGAYFITICVHHRKPILSTIVGGDVLDAPKTKLSAYGKVADACIRQLNEFYEHINVEDYVIMPNHIHLLVSILQNGSTGTSTPTKQHAAIPRFVSTFKRFCNKHYDNNIWQRGYYDHIIRDDMDYEKHRKYIEENPARWQEDELYNKTAPLV